MSGFWVAAAVATAVAGASVYSADQSRKASHRAQDQQKRLAEDAERQRQQDFKRQHRKEVDVSGLHQNAGMSPQSTMLTGAEGVDPSALTLAGQNKLLGG